MITTTSNTPCRLFGHEEGYKKIAEAGFKGIDYSEPFSCYKPLSGIYAASDEEFDAYFENEARLIKNASLIVGQAHAPFPTFPEPAEGINQADEFEFMVSAIKRAIRATRIVGGKLLVIHCAMRLGWRADDDFPKTRVMNRAVYEKLLPAAHENGVVLALENMPCHGIPTAHPDQLIDYIDMMDDAEYFKACLDTGHANITGESCGDYVRALGSRLAALHVHDNDSTRDHHTSPYLGTIDWKGFITALREIDYKGNFSLESDSFSSKYPAELYIAAEGFQRRVAEQLVNMKI